MARVQKQVEFFVKPFFSARNTAFKKALKLLLNASFWLLDKPTVDHFSKSNERILKILLAHHFWVALVLVVNGRLRIKNKCISSEISY